MTAEEYVQENPNAYTWDDGTIDIMFDTEMPFCTIRNNFSCGLCGTPAAQIQSIPNDIYGMFVICETCGQKWFIHKKIPKPIG